MGIRWFCFIIDCDKLRQTDFGKIKLLLCYEVVVKISLLQCFYLYQKLKQCKALSSCTRAI